MIVKEIEYIVHFIKEVIEVSQWGPIDTRYNYIFLVKFLVEQQQSQYPAPYRVFVD